MSNISRWISVNDAVPEDEELVLVIVNGKPSKHITFKEAIELAYWYEDEGWVLEGYPEAVNIEVLYWARIPERVEE